jgi:ribosomal protein L9
VKVENKYGKNMFIYHSWHRADIANTIKKHITVKVETYHIIMFEQIAYAL